MRAGPQSQAVQLHDATQGVQASELKCLTAGGARARRLEHAQGPFICTAERDILRHGQGPWRLQ